jgi:hypothetical protein
MLCRSYFLNQDLDKNFFGPELNMTFFVKNLNFILLADNNSFEAVQIPAQHSHMWVCDTELW